MSKPKRSAASPPASSPPHCYCSDPTPLQSDLICSFNSPQCNATHTSCLKDNAGVPFTDFVVGRSCFLCAHCVGKRGFRHPVAMACTLDSQYGCFYEAKDWRGRGEGGKAEKETTGQGTDEREEEEAIPRSAENGHSSISPSPSSPPLPQVLLPSPYDSTPPLLASPSPPDDDSVEPKAKSKRRGIRDSDRKQRGKLIPRCTSPSHFLTDDPLPPPLPPSSTPANPRLVDKLKTDALLSAVSSLYYRPRLPHLNALDVWVSADYDRLEYGTVDSLLSPLRRVSPLDDWSAWEMAMFEGGLCAYGKDFHAISRLLGGKKTCGECVDFYYVWKKSGHYAMWKEFGKPVRRRNEGKAEQLRSIQQKMKGWGAGTQEGGEGDGTVAGKRKRDDKEENGVEAKEKRSKVEEGNGEGQAEGVDNGAKRNGVGDAMAVS